MQKTIIILSIFLFFSVLYSEVQAQQVNIQGNPNIKTDTLAKQILDNAKYRVYYSMEFLEDTTDINLKIKTQTILLVGSKHNAFRDYNSLRKDSIYDELCRSNTSAMTIYSKVLSVAKLIKFKPTIVKNYPQKDICVFQEMITSKENYRYKDPDIKIDWKLMDGEKNILGYNCKEAICSFRGRDYVAWYCLDIPMSEGPYVFSGLPGLILEISDTRNHYKFSMNGLNAVHGYDPIYILSDNVVETSRDNVRKAIDNIKRDPASLIKSLSGSAVMSPDAIAKLRPKPYNPIELK